MGSKSQNHIANLADRLATELVSRRTFLARAGLATGALVGGGRLLAGAVPAYAEAAPRRGGQLKIAWVDSIDTLDPHFTSSLGAIKVHDNVYNGILKVEFNGRRVSFVPELAEKWEMPDPLTHVFTIRRGVKFHDGSVLTAETVKWNQERVKNPELKSPHAWKLADVEKIEILDTYKLRIKLAKPYQFLPVAWTGSTGRAGTIVSPKAVEKYGKTYGRNPVGTGPFRLKEWLENERIILERNPDYWETGADGQRLPYLDRVTIILYRDPAAAVSAMTAGEVDGMSLVPFPSLAALTKNPNVQLIGGVEGNYTYIGMNNRKPPFDDAALRKAVAFAIDRGPIIDKAYLGAAIQACGAVSPPMADFYRPDQCASKRGQYFDLEKAKALRAQSRYKGDVDAEWMVIGQYTGSGGVGPRMAELCQPMLAKIGVNARVRLYEEAVWKSKRSSGDFQIYDEGWVADLDPDETIYPEWVSGKPWNYVGYTNPEFDRLVTEAQFEANLQKRKALYDQADILLSQDAPCAFVGHFKVFKALAKKVQGFKYVPVDSMRFHTVHL